MEQSDHDLLIEIKTTVKNMAENQSKFEGRLIREVTDIQARVGVLELSRKGDSEKFAAISEQMQRTLNNADRITQAFGEISSTRDSQKSSDENIRLELRNVEEDVREIKSKTNVFDWINFFVAAVAGLIAWFKSNP